MSANLTPNLIPQPVHLEMKAGSFKLTSNTALVASGAAAEAAALFCEWVNPATGFNLRPVTQAPEDQPVISFNLESSLAHLGMEGYRLSVTPERVSLRALELSGLGYAAQTLRQLLPVQIFSPALAVGVAWEIPCLEIEDKPRFGWRGAHLDVARHFMPKEFIFKFLDLLALHKLNVFHWHLTEDQGWRIEIKKYPRLTEVGAWREQTMLGHWRDNREKMQFDGVPHGGFYTQDEVREVVAYAARLGINVLPEIEMPGHSQAAIAAYPELGNTGQQIEVKTGWGIIEHIFNVEESTIRFLQDVLEEVLALFPSKFIHVGGDEVPKKEWRESKRAQQRMRELGLKDEDELQSYFIRRMDAFLTKRGRRLVGWDEILEGGLAPNATVMSWRGEQGGIAAANAGHDVVMAPYPYTYFDYYQSEDTANEPLAIGGFLPLEKAYSYEPIPAEIEPARAHHVLGAQGQLWTEYIPTPTQVEYMAFPRLCALAEVVWTPPERKDFANFSRRLAHHLARLDRLQVNYRKP